VAKGQEKDGRREIVWTSLALVLGYVSLLDLVSAFLLLRCHFCALTARGLANFARLIPVGDTLRLRLLSVVEMADNGPVVLDQGTGFVKAGYAGASECGFNGQRRVGRA
jgi:hypothetical protein